MRGWMAVFALLIYTRSERFYRDAHRLLWDLCYKTETVKSIYIFNRKIILQVTVPILQFFYPFKHKGIRGISGNFPGRLFRA